ncbi:MAG: phosphodiesterase [Parabacteroides sp.]|nr:phosphodiesterase [Parabacteroides sp.]
MKYMILSDIHGCETTLKQALDAFHRTSCDYLLLLGDILYYGPRNCIPEGCNAQGVATLLNQINDKVMAIRGNCDAEVDQMLLDFPCMSDYAWVMDEGNRLFLTHGHIFNEEQMPKGHTDFFFYGHTHLWKLEKKGETVICNVGSITFPKGGNLPTYAINENGRIGIYSLTDHSLLKELSR